jgi:CheY-like chemotaxis protein
MKPRKKKGAWWKGLAKCFVPCKSTKYPLKQVLLNLALNARDAMTAGGELRIESSTVEIDTESHEARLCRPGQYVRLRVTDTVSGMDKAALARIFEPYFTTKEVGFGTGLGLSIAHSIIVQSRGCISAESEIGHGTSFEVLLPCIGSFRKISEITGTEPRAGRDPTPTILLVEDDDAARRLMHKLLAREGFQLLEAGNAEQAELIAEVYEEPIHVLVPERTGAARQPKRRIADLQRVGLNLQLNLRRSREVTHLICRAAHIRWYAESRNMRSPRRVEFGFREQAQCLGEGAG